MKNRIKNLVYTLLAALSFSLSAAADCSSVTTSIKNYRDGKTDSETLKLQVFTGIYQFRESFTHTMTFINKVAPFETSLDGTYASDESWPIAADRLITWNREASCALEQIKKALTPAALKAMGICEYEDPTFQMRRFGAAQLLDRLLNQGQQSQIFKDGFKNDLSFHCILRI